VKVAEMLPEAQQACLLDLRSRLPSKWSTKWTKTKRKLRLKRRR